MDQREPLAHRPATSRPSSTSGRWCTQELVAAGNPDGITNLRWVVAHVPFITPEYVDKLKDLGGGISLVGGWR